MVFFVIVIARDSIEVLLWTLLLFLFWLIRLCDINSSCRNKAFLGLLILTVLVVVMTINFFLNLIVDLVGLQRS